jgi:hypothetical protein
MPNRLPFQIAGLAGLLFAHRDGPFVPENGASARHELIGPRSAAFALDRLNLRPFKAEQIADLLDDNKVPLGRGQLAVFPRCSLDPYDSDMGASLAP